MNLTEIQELVDGWMEGLKYDHIHPMHTACVLQCHLLLVMIRKLDSIESSLSSISNDSWNDHHNR